MGREFGVAPDAALERRSGLAKYEEALELFDKAVRLNPNFPFFYLSAQGLCLLMMERFDEAASAFERGIRRHPEFSPNPKLNGRAASPDPNARSQLAQVYLTARYRGWSDDPDRALVDAYELASEAVRLGPDLPHAHSILGSALFWLG